MKMIFRCALPVIAVLFTSAQAQAAEFELSITKQNEGRIAYAMPGAEKDEVLKMVKGGLERSGYLEQKISQKTADATAAEEGAAGTVSYGAWKTLKVDLLVKPEVEVEGDTVKVTVSLYHITQRSNIFNKRYSNKTNARAALAAFIVDDIVKAITGEKGIENSRIVYVAETEGGKKELFATYPGGRENKQVTFDRNISINPAWMDNGTKILYTSYIQTYPNIYLIDLRTGSRTRFAFFPGLNSQPSASPDGSKVACILSKDGNPEVYTIDAGGGKTRRITSMPSVESSPTWSPDGKKIAYSSDMIGAPQIYIQDLSGGRPERVSFGTNYCTNPDWSPRGNLIACSGLVKDYYQIFVIDVRTKENIQVTHDAIDHEDPSWAPSGRHLLVTVSDKKYNKSMKILSLDSKQMADLPVKGKNPCSGSWVRE